MTYKEIVYMCLDTLKVTSDDSIFNEDHIISLINRYRSILLQQKYADIRNPVSTSNYQTLCLDLTLDNTKSIDICKDTVLRSTEKIPSLLNVGNKEVSLKDYYLGELVLVSPNRLRYVGNNRWLQNVIYCAIGDDNYLYFKSSNPQYQALEKVNIRGIFEDPIAAAKLSCDNSSNCDILDMEIPLEDTLVAKLIEGVIQFVSSGLYKPQDKDNNAADDLSSLMTFIRNNMKSNLQKQIEG